MLSLCPEEPMKKVQPIWIKTDTRCIAGYRTSGRILDIRGRSYNLDECLVLKRESGDYSSLSLESDEVKLPKATPLLKLSHG